MYRIFLVYILLICNCLNVRREETYIYEFGELTTVSLGHYSDIKYYRATVIHGLTAWGSNMGKYFDDVHAGWDSQLADKPCMVEDTAEIAELRKIEQDGEGFLALGDALSSQLRYREAIAVYTKAIEVVPDDIRAYRSRAARYIATLQTGRAEEDFLHCRGMGGDRLDIGYRLGVCCYLSCKYNESISYLEQTYPLCDDEMGIAVIYWHTLGSYQNGTEPRLLHKWHEGMAVGHHTAYEKAVRVFCGTETAEELLLELEREMEDMEFVIALYGACIWLRWNGRQEEYVKQMKRLLQRDGFWPCFAYLAAWNDFNKT